MIAMNDPDRPPTRGEAEWHKMNLRIHAELQARAIEALASAWEQMDGEVTEDGKELADEPSSNK